MATAAATAMPLLDLRTQASYPLQLGASVIKPREAKRYSSVRYNHKPASAEARNSVLSAVNSGHVELVLKDGDGDYKYQSNNSGADGWYVLITKGSAKDTEVVLEKLDDRHEFNLIATPQESDHTVLTGQFPQLSFDEDEALFGDDEPEPADPKDPWDFRNYLKASAVQVPQTPTDRSQSQQATVDRPASSTPVSRPARQPQNPIFAQKKRKANDSAKASSKRVKAGSEPTTAADRPRRDIPQVRIDRKASVRRQSIDDSGELILENETPVSEKPPKHPSAMSLALSGQLGAGPISLRSAASSPASIVASPVPTRPDHVNDGEEFEFGEEGSTPEVAKKQDDDYFGGGGDADDDVDDLELPSPVQERRHSDKLAPGEDVIDDDDDDLDKQLALAMAEDDDIAPPPAGAVESDEESEEE